MDIPTTPRITLQQCVEELRSSCEAISAIQGGDTYYEEDLQIFMQYCSENELIFEDIPRELKQPPFDEGNEQRFVSSYRSAYSAFVSYFDRDGAAVV